MSDSLQPPSFSSNQTTSSRSGRVWKKNSLFADFESPDDHVEQVKRGRGRKPFKKAIKQEKLVLPPPRWIPSSPGLGGRKSTQVQHGNQQHIQNVRRLENNDDSCELLDYQGIVDDSFESIGGGTEDELPKLVAAEEVVLDESNDTYSSIDSLSFQASCPRSGGNNNNPNSSNANRLKSQAQSTYMMEMGGSSKPTRGRKKSVNVGSLDHRLSTTGSTPQISKTNSKKVIKRTSTDKAPVRRVTAYMLWAKEQKGIFAEKFPHMDFTSVSKRLGELWAGVPQAEKKMWKNRAVKQMKSAGGENMKNTAPPKRPRGRRPKLKVQPNGDIIQPNTPNVNIAASNVVVTGNKLAFGKGLSKYMRKKLLQQQMTASAQATSSFSLANASREINHIRNDGINETLVPPPKKYVSNDFYNETPTTSKKIIKGTFYEADGHSSYSQILKNGKREPTLKSYLQYSPKQEEQAPVYKVTGTEPADAAAHLVLLGESLQIIGQRLIETEGQPVSGSLSVLLDSLLCAIPPLLCLTHEVDELKDTIPEETLQKSLNNVAYIMPGL